MSLSQLICYNLSRLQKDIPLAEMRTTIVTAIIAIVNVTIQIPMGISVCIYSEQFNTFSTNIPASQN